ncbi:hypothetical protein Dsin_004817 [Dipteronia sinensis]|uniref:Uncharacterized protein n=1 Tax=Dipteronia sinensis TaxID=43782 RepID=A0AAE0AW99_9ROSI|nr:hypothetical protein Dsin_004817 [Dipteronia sinensis]
MLKSGFGRDFVVGKGNLFSFDGTEVLIKAVAQAIPTYSMRLFQLPIGLCKDLSAITSKFLWGSRDGKRKISWVSWDKLCLPKPCGGLGFKDLSLFNQALLAKQVWRLLHCPNYVVAQLLKAKYCKQDDFLLAKAKPSYSYIWRSLVWGRSLLSKGLRWKVGDGNSIRVFQDRWIPRPGTFKTITSAHDSNLRVAALLNRNGRSWDLSKLDFHLLSINREAILSIPVSWKGGHDCLAWHFEKNGLY